MFCADRPSLRGSAPLDVAYFSLMDNSELALSLRESHLEKVAVYLSRCGLQSNAELTAKGYPEIGWDPVEGERYLDFLRFCVWVNGESVEENSNLVVRLLIRKPECTLPITLQTFLPFHHKFSPQIEDFINFWKFLPDQSQIWWMNESTIFIRLRDVYVAHRTLVAAFQYRIVPRCSVTLAPPPPVKTDRAVRVQ